MAEPTRQFFEGLAAKGHEPLLESFSGTLRFDLRDGERTEHWFVVLKKGDVDVSHRDGDADLALSTDLATFDAIVAGKMNAMAALLRGVVTLRGKPVLLLAFQRLFRGSVGAGDELRAAGHAGGRQ
jgi:putative sterol carrier protein